jgi:probable rRNA maturation factor
VSGARYLGPWRIDLETRPGVPRVVPAAVVARAVRATLEAAGAPAPASVGVVLVGDGEIAALNAAHLSKRGPTDVLSFPLLAADAYPPHPGRTAAPPAPTGPAFSLPPGTRLHLGDIVVSVERAVEQATSGHGGQTGDVRWAPADEVRLLVVHGALHLCGWDHAEPVEEAAMRALEREILAGPA